MPGYLRVLLPLIALVLPASSAFAEFSLPRDVYRIDQLADAVQAAKSRYVPILFLYSDENTDCPLATAASQDVLSEFRASAVIVYAGSTGDDWPRIPTPVKRAINAPEAGRYIPIAVVIKADLEQVLSIIPYIRDADARQANLRKVKLSLRYR